MADNWQSTLDNGLNCQFLAADAVHSSLKGSFVTCLHCGQLLDEEGLTNHHILGMREGHDAEIFKEKHRVCHKCTGWVYPILNNNQKIKFFHKCQVPHIRSPNKYVCANCEMVCKSKSAFIQHTKGGCKKICPQCNNLMFTKLSEYGVEVDHLCYTDFGGSTSTLCSDSL